MGWWIEMVGMVLTAILVVLATGLGAGYAVLYNQISNTLMWNKGVVSEDDLARGVRITEDDMPKEEKYDDDWMLPILQEDPNKLSPHKASPLTADNVFWRTRTCSSINVAK